MIAVEVQTTRVELRDRAIELRRDGLGYRKIAAALDVPRTTVVRWTNPVSAEKGRRSALAWKQGRSGICSNCGGQTRLNKSGRGTSTICGTCAPSHYAPISRAAKIGRGPTVEKLLAFCAEPRRFVEIREHLQITKGHCSAIVGRNLKNGLLTRLARGVYVATVSRAREPEAASPTKSADS